MLITCAFYSNVGWGDEVENAKQESCNVNTLMEHTNMLDKINSKIIEQIFECVEGKQSTIKLDDALDAIQLKLLA